MRRGDGGRDGTEGCGAAGGSIQVDFSVSPKWLKVLTGFKQKEKIGVEYFDTESLEMGKTEMYMEGFKAGLVKDTSFKGLWKVSFTLREF